MRSQLRSSVAVVVMSLVCCLQDHNSNMVYPCQVPAKKPLNGGSCSSCPPCACVASRSAPLLLQPPQLCLALRPVLRAPPRPASSSSALACARSIAHGSQNTLIPSTTQKHPSVHVLIFAFIALDASVHRDYNANTDLWQSKTQSACYCHLIR